MAKLLKLRRGTTTQHGSFTGEQGEVTVDTDKTTLVVHPGGTQGGGEAMLREDLNNMPASGVTAGTYGSSSAIPAITVDAKGRVTSATTSAIDSTSISNGTSNVSVAASGDITVTRAGTERLRASSSGVSINGNLALQDNEKILLGSSDDLQIYHDGSNSVIEDVGTGALVLKADTSVNVVSGLEFMAQFTPNGAADLYYDNSKKLATTSSGIDVTGTVTCDGLTSDGTATIATASGQVIVKDTDSSGNAAQSTIRFHDSANSQLGVAGYVGTANSALSIINSQNDEIRLGTNSTDRLALSADGTVFYPVSNDAMDLGASGQQFRNAYFHGTVNCDGLTCEGTATIQSGTGVVVVKDSDSTGNAVVNYIVGQDSSGGQKWYYGYGSSSNQDLYVSNSAGGQIQFQSSGTTRFTMQAAGHLVPASTSSTDLGSGTLRWRNVYTNDLNLSNEGGANDVDGTWGSWTIQEGEDDLFLLNRRNGKKYKFNLSEVN